MRENVRNGTPLGKDAKKFMDAGQLVPDQLLFGIIKDCLAKPDVQGGWTLGGYPRTISQAEALDEILHSLDQKIDMVLNINVPDEGLIKRLVGRRICKCGSTYQIQYNQAKVAGKCDACGAELIHRADDNETAIRQRLRVNHARTRPLIGYYGKRGIMTIIPGVGNIKEIFNEIAETLNKL